MTRMLRSRISRRVITEQHIALTRQFRERQSRKREKADKGKGKIEQDDDEDAVDRKVGIVDTKMNAASLVRRCKNILERMGGPEGTVPVCSEGELDTSFAYISEHLE
jgi:pyruvate dehydrogenase kinase 2/3/4